MLCFKLLYVLILRQMYMMCVCVCVCVCVLCVCVYVRACVCMWFICIVHRNWVCLINMEKRYRYKIIIINIIIRTFHLEISCYWVYKWTGLGIVCLIKTLFLFVIFKNSPFVCSLLRSLKALAKNAAQIWYRQVNWIRSVRHSVLKNLMQC